MRANRINVTPMVAVTAVVCNDEAEKNARFQRRRRANRPMQGATGSNHELYSLDKKLGASSKSFWCIQDFLSSAGESIGAVCWMGGAAHEVQSVWVLHTGVNQLKCGIFLHGLYNYVLFRSNWFVGGWWFQISV